MQTNDDSVPRVTLSDGTTIPQLGFGTLAVQPDRESSKANAETTGAIVSQALEAGYRHIDTAQSYGTERGVGRAIAASGVPRDELYIASKLANDNHAPDDVRRSVDKTLENLGLEQLDLFLIHWPLPTLYGGDHVSTWKTLTELVAEGRIRSAGVSNFQPAHLDRIVSETGIAPIVSQFELHPYFANTGSVRSVPAAWHSHRSPQPTRPQPRTPHRRNDHSDCHSLGQVRGADHPSLAHAARPHRHPQIHPARARENMAVFDFQLFGRDRVDRRP